MSKLRVNAFSISLDGYGAGLSQSLDAPLGVGGEALHEWFVSTPSFQRSHAQQAPSSAEHQLESAGVDDDFAARSMDNLGAWIMGRNMFSPSRGPWTDDGWKGWWGSNPPYHVPVYVLTHYARAPITMDGGTTFHFVTEGIRAALELAKKSAGGKDIRVGGGVATVREYLEAGLIDELHLAISPVLLGRGEHLFAGLDLPRLGYKCTQHVAAKATHIVLTK